MDVSFICFLQDSSGRHDTEVFLVDYGLARWLNTASLSYKEGKLGAHDGTLMFTSLDAHKGVITSFRSDMEILNFNLVYWLTGTLPWAKFMSDPAKVKSLKEKFLGNLTEELKAALPLHSSYYKDLLSVFEYVSSLKYTERPDYNYLRTKFHQAGSATASSSSRKSKSSPKTPQSSPRKKRPAPRDNSASSEDSTASAMKKRKSVEDDKPKVITNFLS